MKYYTKAWYELMQDIGSADDFKKIPDKIYTAKEIKELYQKKLKKEIREEKRSYDSEPFFLFGPEDIEQDQFDPEDWLIVDEETNEVSVPESIEQVVQQLEEEQRRAMEEFENRPPFDASEIIELFEECYKNRLRACKRTYPDWLVDEVDHRLLALGYLPESIYIKFKEEISAKRKRLQSINRRAEKDLRKQSIDEEIDEALSLHDASLLSLRKAGNDIVMKVRKDGIWPDDQTPYRRVCFQNGIMIEKEVTARKYLSDDFYDSNVAYLYHEIYKIDDGYEIHMMFYTTKGLGYVTLKCTDVRYEDGIEG